MLGFIKRKWKLETQDFQNCIWICFSGASGYSQSRKLFALFIVLKINYKTDVPSDFDHLSNSIVRLQLSIMS